MSALDTLIYILCTIGMFWICYKEGIRQYHHKKNRGVKKVRGKKSTTTYL